MADTEILGIGTLNVKNIESKTAYVSELLKTCDILARQEHWLFNFQLQDLGKFFPSNFVYSRAEDDHNPLPPSQKPRGY